MPRVNKNRRRAVFVDDALWAAIQAAAIKDSRPAASWIRLALAAALELHAVTTARDDR